MSYTGGASTPSLAAELVILTGSKLAISGVLAHVNVPPGCTLDGGAVVVAPATLFMPLLTFVKFLVTDPPAIAVAGTFLVVTVAGLAVVAVTPLVDVAPTDVDVVSPTAVV